MAQRRFKLDEISIKPADWQKLELDDFWRQIKPVLTLIPEHLQDREGFNLTGCTNRFTVITKRRDFDIGSRGMHNYWVHVLDDSVEKDELGMPVNPGQYIFAMRKASTFNEAMILHYSALKHLRANGY